jgi:hypothetical protein
MGGAETIHQVAKVGGGIINDLFQARRRIMVVCPLLSAGIMWETGCAEEKAAEFDSLRIRQVELKRLLRVSIQINAISLCPQAP